MFGVQGETRTLTGQAQHPPAAGAALLRFDVVAASQVGGAAGDVGRRCSRLGALPGQLQRLQRARA